MEKARKSRAFAKEKISFFVGKKSFYAYFVPYGRKFAVVSCDLVTEGKVEKELYSIQENNRSRDWRNGL